MQAIREDIKSRKSFAKDRRKDIGSISLLVLLIISALLWSGTQAYIKTGSQERIITYEGQKTRARFLADSGLEWAKDSLMSDASWSGGKMVLDTGTILVDVIIIPEGYKVISSAESGRAHHSVRGILGEDGKENLILLGYEELYF